MLSDSNGVDRRIAGWFDAKDSPLGGPRLRAIWKEPTPAAAGLAKEFIMPALKGTRTHQNLKDAFAGESQANRRYLYFAKAADIEGHPDVAGLFRDTAEGETGHAHGHLDYLKVVGDPATDKPIGDTKKNLASAVAGETYEYT